MEENKYWVESAKLMEEEFGGGRWSYEYSKRPNWFHAIASKIGLDAQQGFLTNFFNHKFHCGGHSLEMSKDAVNHKP